jgi:hypothetical protein
MIRTRLEAAEEISAARERFLASARTNWAPLFFPAGPSSINRGTSIPMADVSAGSGHATRRREARRLRTPLRVAPREYQSVAEIVCEAIEEPPEHGMSWFEGRDPPIVRESSDVATDR